MACPCCNSYTCGQGCQSGTCPETEDPCLKGRRFFPGHPRYGQIEYVQPCSFIFATKDDFCSIASDPVCYECCDGDGSGRYLGNPEFCLPQNLTHTCCEKVYTKDKIRTVTSLRCSWGPISYTASEAEIFNKAVTIRSDNVFLSFGATGLILRGQWYGRYASGFIDLINSPLWCRRTGYSYAYWGSGSPNTRNQKFVNYDNESVANEVVEEPEPHPFGIPTLELLGVRDSLYCPNENPLP